MPNRSSPARAASSSWRGISCSVDVVHSKEIDPAKEGGRRQKSHVVRSNQHAGEMRHDKPNPADAAADRDLRRDQQGDKPHEPQRRSSTLTPSACASVLPSER